MFKKPTLDAILVDFNKTISKLEALVTVNSGKVNGNRQVIDALNSENETLVTESVKAELIKKKLLDLVG